jgi:hypothetical protein
LLSTIDRVNAGFLRVRQYQIRPEWPNVLILTVLHSAAMRSSHMVDTTGLTGRRGVFDAKRSNTPISTVLHNAAMRSSRVVDATGLMGRHRFAPKRTGIPSFARLTSHHVPSCPNLSQTV